MEYKRLTKYNEYSQNAEVYAYTVDKDVYFDGIDIVGNENSSLAQETIDRLAELEDKIENGTLVELPCPIRTMVYYIASFENKIWFREKRKYGCTIMEIPFELEMLDSYGNNWFLTREEAEKRLLELQREAKL